MDYDFEQLVEAFVYLDDLDKSRATIVAATKQRAASYVALDLGHDMRTARDLVSAWMKSFDGETSVEDRAKSFGETA